MKKYIPFMISIMLFFGFTSTCTSLFAQDTEDELAAQYIQNKEFDKAVVIYEKLFSGKNYAAFYSPFLDCLIELKDYSKAEKTVKKMIRANPGMPKFDVDLGYVYSQAGQEKKASQQYESLIKNVIPDQPQILALANAFLLRNKMDYAIQTYLKGRKLNKDNYSFGFELAEIYAKKHDYENMVNEYLDLIEQYDSYIDEVQNTLQTAISDDAENKISTALKTNLLKRIQKNPDDITCSQMLLWLSIQLKDFETAFIQAKSLDKRTKGLGENVFSLARLAASNGDYTTSEKAYNYIIEKGPDNYYYLNSKMELLNVKYLKITSLYNYTLKDLTDLETLYVATINEFGKSTSTIPLMKDLAHLQAFYLHKTEDALSLLNEAIAMKTAAPKTIAECKIELANILLMSGDVWEATLTYSQVEKDPAFKNEPIGHLAKFDNAKLSYYIGEFAWAKAQLDVLKAATSKLIANDAMELSLLISDNTDEDSTTGALQIYSHADLLSFQNKDDEALKTLDSIEVLYPGHAISDEVLYKKAQIKMKKGLFNDADSLYEKILELYPDDILSDDALFKLAELNEYQFNNKVKAMELYQELITKYPASLFVTEARKRFRALRGDQLN